MLVRRLNLRGEDMSSIYLVARQKDNVLFQL